MDRERLGRVLGRGARMAARTALEAADAATSPAPARGAGGPGTRDARPAGPEILPPRNAASQTWHPASHTKIAQAAASAKTGFAAPLKRASRALWYELTGSFFALFALSFTLAVWKTRAEAASAAAADRYRFFAFCALALLFGYFGVSSFLRARRG